MCYPPPSYRSTSPCPNYFLGPDTLRQERLEYWAKFALTVLYMLDVFDYMIVHFVTTVIHSHWKLVARTPQDFSALI